MEVVSAWDLMALRGEFSQSVRRRGSSIDLIPTFPLFPWHLPKCRQIASDQLAALIRLQNDALLKVNRCTDN